MPVRLSRIPRLLAWWESSLVRVSLSVLLIVAGFAALFVFFSRSYADRVVDFRRQELKRIVQVALSVVEPVRQQQRQGMVSPEQARLIGRDLIRRMVFADEIQDNYLFMGGYGGESLSLPYQPPREGTSEFKLTDADGRSVTQQFIDTATGPDGEGFVEYAYPPPGETVPQRKISYVVGIPEWDSYIGTGMYLGDLEARTQSYLLNALVLTFGLTVLIFLAMYMILQPTAKSYRLLLRLFDRVSRDPDDAPEVPVDQFRPGSEGWQLLSGFQTMLQRWQIGRQRLQESERQLERRVEERTRELTTLLQVSHDVASTLELQPLLGLILDQIKSLVDYTSASVFVAQGEDRELILVDYRGPVARDEMLALRLPGRSAADEARRLRAPVIISDVRGDSPMARLYRAAAGPHMDTHLGHTQCWMGIPLIVKDRVIGVLSLDHSQAGYYTARHASVAMAIASQAAIAIENARLYGQGQELAVLQERQRLARELHDSVSQALYGIALGARTARKLLDRDQEPGQVKAALEKPLDYVLSLSEAGLAEMRALIFELRPESLETEGLVAALAKQAASVQARHNLRVETVFCEEPKMPFECKEALYRIAQEAMHNTVKHARAARVGLRLECGEAGVALEIEDDGAGFDPGGSFPGHLGLKSMRERVERLGGRLTIDSAPGKGTRVRAEVMCRRGAAGQAA